MSPPTDLRTFAVAAPEPVELLSFRWDIVVNRLLAPLAGQADLRVGGLKGADSVSSRNPPFEPLPDPTPPENPASYQLLPMKLARLFVVCGAFAAVLASARAQVFEAEPNDTIAQASPMSSGVTIGGQLSSVSDVDIFSISVPAAGGLAIRLKKGGYSGFHKASVLNAAGAVVASYSTIIELQTTVGLPAGGRYFIRIEPNAWYSWSSETYALTATFQPLTPLITSQPSSQTVLVGRSATVSVTADGVAPLAYQWFKNGTAIASATSESLQFASIKPTDDALYSVRVSNASGSVASNSAKLTVTLLPPTITTQPVNQVETVGSTTVLFVVADGLPSLTYQWLQNGAAIPGANASAFRLSSVATSDAGNYTVLVSNASGAVVSNSAVLSVTPVPTRLINLSILTPIVSGQPLTTGFVISGAFNKRVLIRAIGPSLSSFGVRNAISDPAIALFNSQSVAIDGNDNWNIADASAMAAAGAFALPAVSRDAALVATLSPGNYTVQVVGIGNATGTVLVEIYEVP